MKFHISTQITGPAKSMGFKWLLGEKRVRQLIIMHITKQGCAMVGLGQLIFLRTLKLISGWLQFSYGLLL